jgi:tetratricopeptide (TPR) repeat protein
VNLYPFVLELYPTLVAWRQVRGDFDGARDLLQQLAAIEHRERASNFETAMLRASRVFVRPDADIGRLTQAIRHHRAGRPRHAEAMFEVLLARRETSVVAAAQAADFFAATGRFEQGRDVLLGLDDRRLNRALLIGVYHRRHGQPEEAVRWLTTATSAATHADQARRELAALLVERGDRSAAITLLRESGSGSDELLALLLLLEKVPADATPIHPTVLAEARDLLDRHGSLPATWNLAIRLHVRAGRTDEALKIARRAGLRFPGHDEPARWEAQLVARRTADGGGE